MILIRLPWTITNQGKSIQEREVLFFYYQQSFLLCILYIHMNRMKQLALYLYESYKNFLINSFFLHKFYIFSLIIKDALILFVYLIPLQSFWVSHGWQYSGIFDWLRVRCRWSATLFFGLGGRHQLHVCCYCDALGFALLLPAVSELRVIWGRCHR